MIIRVVLLNKLVQNSNILLIKKKIVNRYNVKGKMVSPVYNLARTYTSFDSIITHSHLTDRSQPNHAHMQCIHKHQMAINKIQIQNQHLIKYHIHIKEWPQMFRIYPIFVINLDQVCIYVRLCVRLFVGNFSLNVKQSISPAASIQMAMKSCISGASFAHIATIAVVYNVVVLSCNFVLFCRAANCYYIEIKLDHISNSHFSY